MVSPIENLHDKQSISCSLVCLRKKILRICTSSKLMKIIQIIRKYLPDNEFEKIIQELLKHKYIKIM